MPWPVAAILAKGSRLQIESLAAVKPEDTTTLTGQVVNKRREGDLHLVDCETTVENQEGQTVARAEAVVSL